MKKLISFGIVLIFTASLSFLASADSCTMRIRVYVSDSFIYKNTVSSFEKEISDAFRKASGVFDAAADISLRYSFTKNNTYIIPTYAAKCSNLSGSNYFNFCNHTGCNNNGPYHHTNYWLISNDLPNSDTTKNFNMLLTASHLCRVNNSGIHGYVNGVQFSSSKRTIISHVENSNGISMLTMDIIHELGHNYSVLDHYGSNSSGDPNCIWGNNRHLDYILKNNKICSTCLSTLRKNNIMYSHN